MFHRTEVSAPPADGKADRADLAAYGAVQQRILTRADQAIRNAMSHADEIFVPLPASGPDRRRRPR